MKPIVIVALITGTFFVSVPANAQPAVAAGGVKNSASYAPPISPNGGIAQGSIFTVFGKNLGPSTAELGFPFPLPTITPVGKVGVSVTVGGTTTQAIILYSGNTQINAVLPSSTPVGTGTLTVTVNGQASAPVPITVVKSSFGIYTVNSAGTGPGIITYGDYSLVTVSNAANPGETLIIWGTGLGPVSGSEAGGALPGDQPSNPVQVFIGGKQAALTYRGRSGCCSGLDQIGAVVPSGVEGCSVPVAIQINDKVSNFASIAVAAKGRTCTDATTGLTSTDFASIFGKSGASFGSVSLSRTRSISPAAGPLPASDTTSDTGSASFDRITFPAGTSFDSSLFRTVSFGACSVTTFNFNGTTVDPFPGLTVTGLDAGPNIAVSGPAGPRTLDPLSGAGKGIYSKKLGDGTPGNYLDNGQYTITGPGGADVGPFTAMIAIPQSLVWTNQADVNTVNRSAGQTITWTGGDPSSYVSIDGSSINFSDTSNLFGAAFHCQERVSVGTFFIPSVVLLSLPTGGGSIGGISIPSGSLSVAATTTTVTFNATGLDLGAVSASSSTSKTVTYQ